METKPATMAQDMKSALDALEAASADWRRASSEAQQARNRETDCLNRVNQAQKAVDALVSKVRTHSPRDSDWDRATRPAFRVPA